MDARADCEDRAVVDELWRPIANGGTAAGALCFLLGALLLLPDASPRAR